MPPIIYQTDRSLSSLSSVLTFCSRSSDRPTSSFLRATFCQTSDRPDLWGQQLCWCNLGPTDELTDRERVVYWTFCQYGGCNYQNPLKTVGSCWNKSWEDHKMLPKWISIWKQQFSRLVFRSLSKMLIAGKRPFVFIFILDEDPNASGETERKFLFL